MHTQKQVQNLTMAWIGDFCFNITQKQNKDQKRTKYLLQYCKYTVKPNIAPSIYKIKLSNPNKNLVNLKIVSNIKKKKQNILEISWFINQYKTQKTHKI